MHWFDFDVEYEHRLRGANTFLAGSKPVHKRNPLRKEDRIIP